MLSLPRRVLLLLKDIPLSQRYRPLPVPIRNNECTHPMSIHRMGAFIFSGPASSAGPALGAPLSRRRPVWRTATFLSVRSNFLRENWRLHVTLDGVNDRGMLTLGGGFVGVR